MGRCRPQLKISPIGSNETATQITTSGRCGSSVAQRSHIIRLCVCVCVLVYVCVCVVCVYYIIICWITFHPYIVRMFYISPGLLCGRPCIYIGRRKKNTPSSFHARPIVLRAAVPRTHAEGWNYLKIVNTRISTHRARTHAHRTAAHSHENTNRRNNYIL